MNRIPWERFGARLGIGLSLAGFVLIFLGWNGAASVDRLTAQFPYLISGGIAGLGLIVIGAALIIVQVGREDRERLHEQISELRAALGEGAAVSPNGKAAPAPVTPSRGQFVAGQTTYHLTTCRLLEGRGELERVSREEVTDRGLAACRVCEPDRQGRTTARRQGR